MNETITRLQEFLNAPSGRHGRNLSDTERLVSGVGGGGLVLAGLRRGGALGALTALLGGALLGRAISGHCAVKQRLAATAEKKRLAADHGWQSAAAVSHATVIQRPIAHVYAFCRDFRNLPQFMRHLRRVDVQDDHRSHWVIDAPLGRTLEWDTVITEDRPLERISWESAPESSIRHTGWMQFHAIPAIGTEIKAFIAYEPPAGELGRIVAKLWGSQPGAQAGDDLQRLKAFLEAGQDYANASEDGD
jgi:uncharacterized membrane protein